MFGRSIVETLCLAVACVACGSFRCCNAEETARESAIKAGDKVRVINGPAPVKDGEKTLATAETGTEFEALKVQGDWVQVKVAKEGWVYKGWVKASKHLAALPSGGAGKENPVSEKEPPKAQSLPPAVKEGKAESSARQDTQVVRITAVNETGGNLTVGLTPKDNRKEIKQELGPGKEMTFTLRKGPYEAFYYCKAERGSSVTATATGIVVDKNERWIFELNTNIGAVERRVEPWNRSNSGWRSSGWLRVQMFTP